MVTCKLVDFICNIDFEQLTTNTIKMTGLVLLDWLGSAAAGSKEPPAEMILNLVKELGGNPEATLLAGGAKSSCLNAALLNGAISHIVELDDVHRASIIHPGAAILPAVLALAEKRNISGRDLITSIVVGYEVAIRVAEAITPSHYYYWHTTGTCGTFGAAAAVSKLLGLDANKTTWALGNAGTQASGLWEFLADGAMSKHLHSGKAAMNGMLAALLAERGFTGATRILEGERGFCWATANEVDFSKITEGLGEAPYKIEEISFKIHSSCRHTHSAVDVVLEMLQKYKFIIDEVERIRIRTYKTALDITNNYNPCSTYAAKFSMPFCIALALSKGKCGFDEFKKVSFDDSEIHALMKKIEIILDPELDAQHPELWPARVEISTIAGDVYEGFSGYPMGDPENPVSREQLEQKFLTMASQPWGIDKAKIILEACRNIENTTQISKLLP